MKKYAQYIKDTHPNITLKDFELLLQEVYIKESNREDRPLFYENEMYSNCIDLFDKLIVAVLSRNNKSFIVCKTEKKKKELKKEFKNFNIIAIDNIYATYKRNKKLKEYITISNYHDSLFRIIYRHLYNDKENFHIVKDNIKNGYIIFNIKNENSKKYHFRSQLPEQNIVQHRSDILNKVKESIKELKELEDNNKLRVDRVHPKIFIEKLIYQTFISSLEGTILMDLLNKNTNKITIAKSKSDDNSRIKNKNNVVYIEELVPNLIKELRAEIHNSYINPQEAEKELISFDDEKYIYPCWVMACDHFFNNGMNYNVIEGDRYEGYLNLRVFI